MTLHRTPGTMGATWIKDEIRKAEAMQLHTISIIAREMFHDAHAASWCGVSTQRDYLTGQMHEDFTRLAEAMGYRVERIPTVDPEVFARSEVEA